MDIRSITLFCSPDLAPQRVDAFFRATTGLFPYQLQTRRVAFPPFPVWWSDRYDASYLVQQWQALGANYLSLGPVQLRHEASWLDQLPDLLAVGDALFASAEVADCAGTVDIGRALAVARVIRAASARLANGFGNLYFTALANCPPGSPFFPVAYHRGGPPSFALAIEGADLAVKSFSGAATLAEARSRLVAAIEAASRALVPAAERLAAEQDIVFAGLDFSLAPFPEDEKSLAGAMEALGLAWVGAAGSLFAASFITDAIGRADFPRCGFSGLMLPVLEDSVLAARTAEGYVGLSDLLSYAAVCGVGLDTIPLAGDITEEAIAAILLDIAALAVRLDKPLTARLMPIPGLHAGDPVHFDFPYFADSRVMLIAGPGVGGLLIADQDITLAPYRGKG
jgi:hypothetical protein